MSVTTTRVQTARPMGSDLFTVTEAVLDSSYASEGEPLPVKELGLRRLSFPPLCFIQHGDEGKSSEQFAGVAYYSTSTEKLHVINLKEGKEVASTKNMEKLKVQIVAFGKP